MAFQFSEEDRIVHVGKEGRSDLVNMDWVKDTEPPPERAGHARDVLPSTEESVRDRAHLQCHTGGCLLPHLEEHRASEVLPVHAPCL